MSKRRIRHLVFGLLVAGLIPAGAAGGQAPREPQTAKEIEAFLSSARVASVEKDAEMGRSLPWRVTLDDGEFQARAMFKYIDRRTVQSSRHSYRYELAAYDFSRLLDLEIVPPVVLRDIEGSPGSLQWYAENCRSERDRRRLNLAPRELEAFLHRLEIVQIFEALVNDDCGDQDDTLIHKDSWEICRVDFSAAFRPSPSLSTGCLVRRCSRTLFHRLEDLKRPVIANRMKPYLNGQEIDALFRRVRQFIDLIKNEIRDKGEAAVLFDLKNPEPRGAGHD
ncbi:MAG: hypothetical protein JW843_06000 [Candidatus Aminicenantes bacterium]|nr:hypothetical protein [Candidatus Aminicenantes bacterium]